MIRTTLGSERKSGPLGLRVLVVKQVGYRTERLRMCSWVFIRVHYNTRIGFKQQLHSHDTHVIYPVSNKQKFMSIREVALLFVLEGLLRFDF